MNDPTHKITVLLKLVQENPPNQEYRDALYDLVRERLRRLAGKLMKGERAGHSLQGTILEHDAFLAMINSATDPFRDREHFYSWALVVMQNRLKDHARKKHTGKRGAGEQPVGLDQIADVSDRGRDDPADLAAMREVLSSFETRFPGPFMVFELHCIGQYGLQEIAEKMGISHSTVKRHWKFAQAYLQTNLLGEEPDGE